MYVCVCVCVSCVNSEIKYNDADKGRCDDGMRRTRMAIGSVKTKKRPVQTPRYDDNVGHTNVKYLSVGCGQHGYSLLPLNHTCQHLVRGTNLSPVKRDKTGHSVIRGHSIALKYSNHHYSSSYKTLALRTDRYCYCYDISSGRCRFVCLCVCVHTCVSDSIVHSTRP